MNTISIDTHKTIRKLMEKGFSEEQAEGVVEVLEESGLASETGLQELKRDLSAKIDIGNANVKSSIIQWVAALLIAQAAAIVALQNLIG